MNTKFVTILTLGALPFIATAMPTKAELDKVSPVVADLMKPEQEALKAGKKSKSEVAAAALDLVAKADGEAAKLLLTKGAYNLYVRDGEFDKAIETLKSFREIVPDIEPQYLANIIESSLRTISRKNGGQLYQLLDETRTIARYRDELKKLEAQAKKTPTDKSLQLKLAEHYAVLNDWPKALAAFEQSTDAKSAAAAKVEQPGDATLSSRRNENAPTTLKFAADHWWNYPARKAPEFEKPFHQHAAKLYEQAIATGELVGLNKVQAERRLEEAKALGEVAYETPAPKDGLYCVIDLSGGPNAKHYPVSYLNVVPKGGWTDKYKTNKLVLRKIKSGREPLSRYEISNPYFIGIYEVTQRQWELVMGNNPSVVKGDNKPVENVSAMIVRGGGDLRTVANQSFIGVLRYKTGIIDLDLPTSEQWEYACRSGAKGDYCSGDDIAEAKQYGWMNASRIPEPVGTKRENLWGLFDMHGNVWEIVLHSSFTGISKRGGACVNDERICSLSHKVGEGMGVNAKDAWTGFRLAIQLK